MGVAPVRAMLGKLPLLKKGHGAPLQSRKAMLETLFRHLDMVRLSVGAILMVVMVGCTGLIDGGGSGSGSDTTTQQKDAQQQWLQAALPVLKTSCVSCHNGSRANVGFLVGAAELDIRGTVLKFDPPAVNLDAPGSSRILTKGVHDGPALTATDSATLLEWLQAERDAQDSAPGTTPAAQLQIPPYTVKVCTAGRPDNTDGTCPTNHIALSTVGDAGAAVPGAEISFVAQALTSALYLTDLKITGGTAGAYLEHPLFVSRPAQGDAIPDQIDRYFALKQNTKADTTDQIDGGTAVFVGFDATNPIVIAFKTVSGFKPATGGGGMPGGCKVLASFKANAVGPLNTYCKSCHANNQNAGAQGAMDITGVDTADDAKLLTACNQVHTRINLTTTDQSGFYLAPDPASATNHPFKFPAGQFTSNFKTPVDIWVQAEKTAP